VRSSATTPAAVVAVDRLCVRRGGRVVLDDLSCSVRRGAVTGLLGPSGSGKSTLIRSLLGIQRTASGTVAVLGAAAGTPALRGKIGYFPQGGALYGDLSVRENLRYFARVLGASAAEVERALEVVALTALAGAVVDRLSGGERARASLAVALLAAPPLLLLDEPTVGLDPVLRRDLWRTFRGLAAGGTTLLVSSHVMDEAAHCDELLLLREGRLLAAGTPDELRARAGADDLDAAFLRLAEDG
jgi:ABC-2 type transport system ATP-binding protein